LSLAIVDRPRNRGGPARVVLWTQEELTKANVEWQVMMFGGAVHSFCDPTADAGPTRYDEKLCRKSYMLMRDFFAETL
jgi:dienelactone hydrolase